MARRKVLVNTTALAVAVTVATGVANPAFATGDRAKTGDRPDIVAPSTTTPIKHLVVIFGENVSFDHYFGTYPKATNTDGTPFKAAPGTPKVNGLTAQLLNHNPNGANPQRLGPEQAVTCDQDHGYTAEQLAYDGGAMDKFVEFTNRSNCADSRMYRAPGLVMDYYDGNTVTALWNYAQRFAMSDNSYGTTFGPSTPGALNLISGQTGGAVEYPAGTNLTQSGTPITTTTDTYAVRARNAQGVGTVINDPDPYFDKCSSTKYPTVAMQGPNIGDLLNAAGVTWGWFDGGFADCSATHANIAGITSTDYIPHHEPFQYYRSTANPQHLPPASVSEIGHNGQANHQYDMTDWYRALDHGNLPAVSFLKAPAYQDGHAAYSDPIDEQHFIVEVMNRLQASPYWKSTAVVIAYDDSDGWYDHQPSPVVNASAYADDALNGPSACTRTPAGGTTNRLDGYQDRCGYGPRLPLLVLSPYAKSNYVDHSITDQSSILRFIEDNWLAGARIPGSYDRLAGSLDTMFHFNKRVDNPLFLNLDGSPSYDNVRHPGRNGHHGGNRGKGH